MPLLPGDERLTTAIVSDALDEAGFRSQVLGQRFAPIVPGSRVFGRAATVRFVPDERDEPADPYSAAIEFVDGLRSGELVVIATGESTASAVWGELFSAAAIGGISIADGDLVIADDDGAVVIPQDAEQTVLRIARARASGESTVLAELLAGESLRAVWDRHRIL